VWPRAWLRLYGINEHELKVISREPQVGCGKHGEYHGDMIGISWRSIVAGECWAMLGIDLGSHGGFLWMNFITTESYDVTAERMVRIWGGVTIPEWPQFRFVICW
jgi:hypothetical protein